MKKFLLAAAMVFSALQPAMATELQAEQQNYSAAQSENNELRHGGGNIGAVIGGIIVGAAIGSLVTADRYERHPGYRPHYRDIVCYAEGSDRWGRGERFRARGERARWAQQRALDKCYSYYRFCRPLGCEARW